AADDPKPTWGELKSRSAAVSLPCRGMLSFRWEARESPAVKRRDFITLAGAAVWPLPARAADDACPRFPAPRPRRPIRVSHSQFPQGPEPIGLCGARKS